MTRRMRFIVVVMVGVLFALSARLTAQSKVDLALRAAMETETVKGDLKSAIAQYRQIAQGSDRALAAKALLRMAECYQKLGDAQAQDVYTRLVRDYSDQPSAAEARARIAVSGVPTSALVWQPGEGDEFEVTAVSADGRYICATDWATGNLVLRDLATATNRLVVPANNPNPGHVDIYAEGCAISRDGTQVAYEWSDEKSDRTELWVASLRGERKPRRVYGDAGISWIWPTDWSPDGRSIAFDLKVANRKEQLVVVSVEDGKARVLKDGYSARIVFSQDGRYVAYDLPQDVTGARDVWVTALDGATDAAVVANRGNDIVMGWLPDEHLLVGSDRVSTTELISVAIHNGAVQGAPKTLKTDIGRVAPLGVTTAGALFYTPKRDAGGGSIQVAEFDSRSGSVTSPHDVSTDPQDNNVNPSWSPDGKYLAYLSGRPRGTQVIVIRAANTRTLVREIEPNFKPQTVGEWQPDSKALLVTGTDANGRSGAFRVDIETGETSFLLAADAGHVGVIPVWSADGRALYYWKRIDGGDEAFFAHDMASGADKQIVRRPFLGGLSVSLDGRILATETVDAAKNERVLLLVPLDGTAPREVMRVPAGVPSQDLTNLANRGARVAPASWLPDSQSLIARLIQQPDGESELWQVPVDGSPARRLPSKLEANIKKFTLSPDGRHVAYRLIEPRMRVPVEVWKYANFQRPVSTTKR